jgi:hypothetical protein
MPIVASRFQPPAFLRNGHIQTILQRSLLFKVRLEQAEPIQSNLP